VITWLAWSSVDDTPRRHSNTSNSILFTFQMINRHPQNARVLVLVATAMILIAVILFIVFRGDDRDRAISAFSTGQFKEALRYARSAVVLHPGDLGIILIGADAAERMGDSAGAIEFLGYLPPQFDDYSVYSGWLTKADLLIRTGKVTEARVILEQLVADVEDDVMATRKLAGLLSGCGQRFEALPLLQTLLAKGTIVQEDLVQLARNGRALFSPTQLSRLHSINPQDPMPVAGLIASAWETREENQVAELIENCPLESPELLRDQLKWRLWSGETVGYNGQNVDVRVLVNKLEGGSPHPDTLLLLAQLAIQKRDINKAHRLLRRSILLDRWNTNALQTMSDLVQASEPKIAVQLRELVVVLKRIEHRVGEVMGDVVDSQSIRLLTDDLLNIRRRSEAIEWARIALKQDPAIGWAIDLILDSNGEKRMLRSQASFVHPIDLLIHEPGEMNVSGGFEADAVVDLSTKPKFDDVASDVGIDFLYDNGTSVDQQGLKMHQWTGGGVAVVDIDGDSWPDLYFAQGGRIGNVTGLNGSDTLFRNQRGLGFLAVTKMSQISETGFGQGVAAGDVNNDGFDDLYVANVGANRLLINMGDGTFVASQLPDGLSVWTTSAAIADVNGDSQPDLYDVNYLSGDDVFTRTCEHGGVQRICGPTDFLAEPDIVLFSDGSGGFVQKTVPDPSMDARGMGLVIANLVDSETNTIYVTTDEAANQMLQVAWPEFVVRNSAFESGVALNQSGQAQGSMGIALGDYDLNGHPDLFVTNYYSEANTLYSQVARSAFIDQTLAAGLAAPGFALLGFGCQFLDADSDGDQDLVVANGHLDDFTHVGHPFRMMPQLFLNDGGTKFGEATVAGDYFSQKRLGRAIATLDWNRDLRCDFVVTHLVDPASLVMNTSSQRRATLSLRLIGTQSARVPIGASAELNGVGRRQRAWLAAGNGYQCSNERQLRLARSNPADGHTVSIYWPGDSTERVVELPLGSESIVVEGRSLAYVMPR